MGRPFIFKFLLYVSPAIITLPLFDTSVSFSGNAIRVIANIGTSFSINYGSKPIGTIGSLPQSHITASGSTNICAGSSITLSSPVSGNIVSRKWQKNSVDIAGANGITYVANASGAYRIITTSVTGCDSTSNVINITTKSVPAQGVSEPVYVMLAVGTDLVVILITLLVLSQPVTLVVITLYAPDALAT